MNGVPAALGGRRSRVPRRRDATRSERQVSEMKMSEISTKPYLIRAIYEWCAGGARRTAEQGPASAGCDPKRAPSVGNEDV